MVSLHIAAEQKNNEEEQIRLSCMIYEWNRDREISRDSEGVFEFSWSNVCDSWDLGFFFQYSNIYEGGIFPLVSIFLGVTRKKFPKANSHNSDQTPTGCNHAT